MASSPPSGPSGHAGAYDRSVRPAVRYAKSGDVRLAYQVLGAGPPDLVFQPGFVSHLDLAWEEPFLAGFLRGLAGFARLIWFDKRGAGLSDPVDAEPPVEVRVDDVGAVMDAAGSARATLFGVSEGASLSVLYAARHPERVASLVLFSGFARLVRSDDHPWSWSPEFFEAFLAGIDGIWETGEGMELPNPSLGGDERYRAWLLRYLRSAGSPTVVRRIMTSNAAIDLRPILAGVDIPVLLLHRVDDGWCEIGNSRFLASQLPDATLVELPGVDHWPWIGDADSVLAEIERFVAGAARSRRARPRWGPDSLTSREREVARLAADGHSAADIAGRLGIGERTVETHLVHAYRKLDVGSKVELARRAADLGL